MAFYSVMQARPLLDERKYKELIDPRIVDSMMSTSSLDGSSNRKMP
ncbi:hypothetical protein CK203_107750 [Vitis vinifera]|uniref:Uncharacterized protein n=1 Tax=Vitis vinifera TaxID=29760 RepID=A0A438C691_VITVI|nr:hypothetical protein CK203_107750 [Vitis vinifera]